MSEEEKPDYVEMELSQENVDEALNRGLENDNQFLDEASADQIADDLKDFDTDFVQFTNAELIPFIQNWKDRRERR